MEPGETKQAALVRECREELGVTISVGEVYLEVTHAYPDLTIHLTLFEGRILEGTLQKLEHADLRWVRAEELPNYAFCPADAAIIRAIVARFSQS